ncbi:Zn-dependent protease [Lutibacter profundi]|uniref:Zn-dependent protease n=2 Tax=Lutibacter profundi TaxID=1622118 RepID=A0A0X8G5I4_9FLAO|nr:Zn-dependent protease [Lutibacter profundi]
MMKSFSIIILIFMMNFEGNSQQFYSKKEPFAHTYSIVARDTVTGEMGVAVQSHWFSVGSLVAWGEAGVGVVATQSFINPSFGPRGLSLLKNGLTPKMAVESLLELDEGREVRQLAILDVQGNVAAYTGKNCIEMAGHIVGDNFSVQANLMEKSTVWPAMAKAFKNSKGALAERLLIALEAAQKEGGDIRGKQSAAILVVKAKSTGNSWEDKVVDLRVEDNENPLKEMRRLLTIHTAYEYMNKGDLAVETGNNKLAKEYYMKAQQLNPNNLEMKYWYAVTLANNGELTEATQIFKLIFEQNNKWRELIPRLLKAKLLKVSEKQLKEILNL